MEFSIVCAVVSGGSERAERLFHAISTSLYSHEELKYQNFFSFDPNCCGIIVNATSSGARRAPTVRRGKLGDFAENKREGEKVSHKNLRVSRLALPAVRRVVLVDTAGSLC